MSEEQTPAQMREQLDALAKDLDKSKKSNADLLKENRTLKGTLAFSGAGLDPGLADLFVASNPDAEITAEAAKEFAAKWGIQGVAAPPEPAEPEETPTPVPEAGLAGFERAGSSAGQGGQPPAGNQTMSSGEFAKLLSTDKAAAQKALAEGRVRVRDDNPLARDRVSSGTENPYDKANRERLEANQS